MRITPARPELVRPRPPPPSPRRAPAPARVDTFTPGPRLPDLGAALRERLLGPDYPTTAEQRAQDTERLLAKFGPALAALGPEDRRMLDQISRLGMSPVDLLRGSHAVVADGGRLYDAWRDGATPRISSHYPGVPTQQYERALPGLGVLLFGKDASGNTWFQLEAHPVSDLLGHGGDFVMHVLSGGLNIGPGGTSPHSETRGDALQLPDAP